MKLKDKQENDTKQMMDGFGNGNLINVCPLDGHKVTWDYRTKMIDWMVEVCTTFKCSHRAYFLAVQIFDKVL